MLPDLPTASLSGVCSQPSIEKFTYHLWRLHDCFADLREAIFVAKLVFSFRIGSHLLHGYLTGFQRRTSTSSPRMRTN